MPALTDSPPQPGSLQALKSTLDARYWLLAGIGTVAALVVLGVPTAVVPNPFFVRMTPTETFNIVVWLASAPLIGLLIATYLRRPRRAIDDDRGEPGTGRATLGGVAAYLAIGCPICNKVVVAALGLSGSLSYFAPLQPILGAGSVALLGATLIWRLRARTHRCERCVV